MAKIFHLKSEMYKLQADNDQLKPTLKTAQDQLIAIENYTRKENLCFMNIHERKGRNCTDIVYGIIENDLKIWADDSMLSIGWGNLLYKATAQLLLAHGRQSQDL